MAQLDTSAVTGGHFLALDYLLDKSSVLGKAISRKNRVDTGVAVVQWRRS